MADRAPADARSPELPPSRLRGLSLCVLALTAAIAVTVWLPIKYGRTNIWSVDGMTQHYAALHHANVLVRDFAAHPSHGLPMWSWNLGLGADTLGTLSYYTIGDPFVLISLLFPMSRLELAYEVMFYARLLCAGLAAFLYMRRMRSSSLAAAMGAVAYAFTTYSMFLALRHPYFATAMVLLPLLLIGVEQVLAHEPPWRFVIAVCVAAISNFYFFYILTLMTSVYAVVRYVETTAPQSRRKRLMPEALRFGGLYLLGVALASVSLVPTILSFLGSSRNAAANEYGLFHPAIEYGRYLLGLIVPLISSDSAVGGFAAPMLVMLPVMILRRRENRTALTMLTLLGVSVIFPFFGSVWNGLSYPCYRMVFAIGLFLAYGTATLLTDQRPFSRTELRWMFAMAGVVLTALAVGQAFVPMLIVLPGVIGMLTCVLLAFESFRAEGRGEAARTRTVGGESPYRVAILALVIVNVAANAFTLYGKGQLNHLSEYERRGTVAARYAENQGTLAAGLPAESGGPYRVEKQSYVYSDIGHKVVSNDALVQRYMGTSFYFSLMDAGIFEYLRGLGDRGLWYTYGFTGFDDRAALETLAGVRYYISDDALEPFVPFGYSPVSHEGTTTVYRNDHALPVGFIYYEQVSRKKYAGLEPLEKQQALLHGVVSNAARGLPAADTSSEIIDVPFTVETSGATRYDATGHTLSVESSHSMVTLKTRPVPDAEVYVEIDGFEYAQTESPTLRSLRSKCSPKAWLGYFSEWQEHHPDEHVYLHYDVGGPSKAERWETPDFRYYSNNHLQLVNLGYQRDGTSMIRFRTSKAGALHFDRIRVLAIPVKPYEESTGLLADSPLTGIRLGRDRLSGKVTADRSGVLYLSIPYSTGWRASVDGHAADIERANIAFSGIRLEPGTHRIELRYRTPGLRVGVLASLISALLLIALRTVERRRGGTRRVTGR